MDANVEMTETSNRRDDDTMQVGSDEEMDVRPYYSRHISGQNKWLTGATFTVFVGIAVFVLSKVYMTPDEMSGSSTAIHEEQGGEVMGRHEIGQAVKHLYENDSIDQLMTHRSKGEKREPPELTKEQKRLKIRKWLNANVTLQDGIKYEIVGETLKHDPQAFLEGLTFANGVLYESVGLNDQSDVRILDIATGNVIEKYPLAGRYFGEGLTHVNGKLIQLTYKAKVGFVYDVNYLTQPPIEFNYSTSTGEGWGLTYDRHRNELIVSDGSSSLLYWDPDTFEEIRRVEIKRQDGKPAVWMNELEFWRGRVIANIWYEDTIIVINPRTGIVEKEYDFSQLYPKNQRKKDKADVLNGISITDVEDTLLVTGKLWNRMYKVRLLY